ncbi:uncharacterized protein F54H12.2-like [Melitaea cinxia]|uniref:uncharacterized protein F54H12.2-like n=1 Tax=Melitaea cinxia TaxID=113334 RepID=UPI001E270C52|nr:uncharacterized protein F54H12.2-like [Melitaea cinxia]
MSFLHSHSCECIKSELDLFALPSTQTSIESGMWVQYKPISSLADDGPIEFQVPGTGDDYIDLSHTLIQLKAKILNEDSSKLAASTVVAPVNNWLHSVFTQLDVYLNQKLVSPPNNTYAYRAYIKTLLNYSSEAKQSHLTCSLWYEDTAGKMDSTEEKNSGFTKRQQLVSESKEVEMIGHLHGDIFNQEKFLINGVEMSIKLVRSRETFNLMAPTDDVKYKINITDATLLVRRTKINPSVLLAHQKVLATTTAKYPITRAEVKVLTIPSGVQGTGIHFLNEGNGISHDKYSKGYCLLAFDLTPDLSANSFSHWNLIRHGSVRLEVRFESALTQTINCVVYAEFDNVIEIDKNRNVTVDYSS